MLCSDLEHPLTPSHVILYAFVAGYIHYACNKGKSKARYRSYRRIHIVGHAVQPFKSPRGEVDSPSSSLSPSPSNQLLMAPRNIFHTLPSAGVVSSMSLVRKLKSARNYMTQLYFQQK